VTDAVRSPAQPGASGRPAPRPSLIRIEGLSKRFGTVPALVDIGLDIAEGEFFSLLGASGCGKSTLLRMIAGLERPDSGRILVDGVDITGTPAYRRPVNIMFQSYALFPHMTVAENVAFGLKQDGLPREVVRERTGQALALVQMEPFAARRPNQLSGGQQQRVALGRALAKEPRILLLDEPLAALDRKLREQTRFELSNLQRRIGVTFIMVSHDQEEVMTVSSRIAVMDAGRIVQVGAPREIYDRPASRFVADFVGDANLFDAAFVRIEAGRAIYHCDAAGGDLVTAAPQTPPRASQPATILVRPERIGLGLAPSAGASSLAGTLRETAYMGSQSVHRVELASGQLVRVSLANTGAEAHWELGARVFLSWPPEAATVIPA
jgi:putrescine transport system ATP-binding protein